MASTVVRLRRSLSVSNTATAYSLLHTPTQPPQPRNPTSAATSLSSLTRFDSPFHSLLRPRHFHSTPPSLYARNNSFDDDKLDPDAILFEGCDYNHWLITMDFPKDPKPTSEEMVETYVQTLAKVVGSVEEAKKRMYYYCTASYTAFYAKIGEEASKKLKGIPGVVSVLPNSYSFHQTKEDEVLQGEESESGNLHVQSRAEQDLLSLSDLETVVERENGGEHQRRSELWDGKGNVENEERSEEAVEILEDDVKDEVKFWRTSLIGYVLGERVSHEKIAKYVESKWNKVTPPRIIGHRRGFFIFRFETEEDRIAILKSRNRSFYSKLFILRPWEPDLDIDRVDVDRFTSWVRFPDLKLQFWGDRVLKKIASRVGVPIRIDRLTAEKKVLSYARVLIDVDIAKEPVKEIKLKSPNGQIVQQKVVYEFLPHRCPNCNIWVLVGHKCPLACKKNPGSKKAVK